MQEKEVGVMTPSEKLRTRAAEAAEQLLREGAPSSSFVLFDEGEGKEMTVVISTTEEKISIPLGAVEINGKRFFFGLPEEEIIGHA